LYSAPHNLEQTPSENSAIKLASKDNLLGYQDIYELYSNQFLPLQYNVDILDRIYLQGLFDSKMTGGAIAHLNVLERITDKEVLINLIHKASAMGVVYTAINYNLQKCTNEHMSVGRNETCPVCNADITDNFTRVVGFMVNTKNFHKVRRKVDYPNRVFYREVE
jgi:ribonucleoside-triphosphate reductase